eukprot:SAG31_NODE_8200_length_1498_cov_1.052895_2_plen_299_part_01
MSEGTASSAAQRELPAVLVDGARLMEQQRWAEAARELESTLKTPGRVPNDCLETRLLGHTFLSRAQERQGHDAAAAKQLRQAATLAGQLGQRARQRKLLLELVPIKRRLGGLDATIDTLQQAVDLPVPDDVGMISEQEAHVQVIGLMRLGEALLASGLGAREANAVARLAGALRLHRARRSHVKAELGSKLASGVAESVDSLESYLLELRVQELLAQALLQQGDRAAARAVLEEATQLVAPGTVSTRNEKAGSWGVPRLPPPSIRDDPQMLLQQTDLLEMLADCVDEPQTALSTRKRLV